MTGNRALLAEKVWNVKTRLDLADFISALREDLSRNSQEWENPTLDQFLFAMENWMRAKDHRFKNGAREASTDPTWKTFADILMASTLYE